MKQCKNCSKSFNDDLNYCPQCGKQLRSISAKPSSKKIVLAISLGFVFLIIIGMFYEYSIVQRQKSKIAQDQYQKAVEEQRNTPSTSDLTINSGWTHRIEGDYINIDGSVTNSSSKDISYYEIGVKFIDESGDVVDTDWTNGTDVCSGESQQFNIMHKFNYRYSKIELYIKDIS